MANEATIHHEVKEILGGELQIVFVTCFKSKGELHKFCDSKDFLNKLGFKFGGWQSSEGLFASSAHRMYGDDIYVSLTDAEPFIDTLNRPVHPAPKWCPAGGAIEVFIYCGPFHKDWNWEDGAPPTVFDDNQNMEWSAIFRTANEAIMFIDPYVALLQRK